MSSPLYVHWHRGGSQQRVDRNMMDGQTWNVYSSAMKAPSSVQATTSKESNEEEGAAM
jgi:hypothetical protein